MHRTSKLEVWAGLEGTVNRVGDDYHDQCHHNGHRERDGDLRHFAALGIRRIRYPFLWELMAPESPEQLKDDSRWAWTDARMNEFKELGLQPIAGLVHHGSGPRYTSLKDPMFPQLFAQYAAEFARRYPDVTDYTPINEPLTTARFSGLYGVWYPHEKSDTSFLRMLLHETQATRLAMEEIRKVNPHARLIQTDDLGKCTSTPPLQYQADFENERRWLAFDLLCGKVTPTHPLYKWMLKSGITAEELQDFAERPCPPDIIGINHYPLSNRFLDHRLHLHPIEFHGGNDRDRYADRGAIDVPFVRPPAPERILMEAWERYRIPLVITEVHVNGTREQQLQWFQKMWAAALDARASGADLRAVTAWSLLGAYNWNTLCTQNIGFYESGVFDVSQRKPRPTALARLLQALIKDENAHLEHHRHLFSRPILITGGNGTLGRAFARICKQRGLNAETVTRDRMDIADETKVRDAIRTIKPWAIINTAGYVRVDDAEREPERCFRENVVGPETLARICAEKDLPFITFSSDMVFDGESSTPYVESSPVNPRNVYGHSKAEAERRVLTAHPKALVVRTSSFFGPWDPHNFVYHALDTISHGKPFVAAQDLHISPTYVPDLVNACLDLLIDGESGIAHLTNEGDLSWADLAREVSRIAGERFWREKRFDPSLVVGSESADLRLPAPRPRYTAMSSERFRACGPVSNALQRYFTDLKLPVGDLIQ